mmetsp:Transcript_39758/g.89035  ORF Transcript_39758/g.89035 Transcript_39758/m.89035 type:complete len:221 (+) Transcript_39758:64-726(+)
MSMYYDDPYYGGYSGGYSRYGGLPPATTYRSSPRYYDSYDYGDYGYGSYGGYYDDYHAPRAVPVTAQVYERAPPSYRRPPTSYVREYDYLPPATTYIERAPAPVTTSYIAPPVYAAPPVTSFMQQPTTFVQPATSYVQPAYMPQATTFMQQPPAYAMPQQSMTTFTGMPTGYPQQPQYPQQPDPYPPYPQQPHTHKETRPVSSYPSPQPTRTKKKKGSCP